MDSNSSQTDEFENAGGRFNEDRKPLLSFKKIHREILFLRNHLKVSLSMGTYERRFRRAFFIKS